MAKMIVDTKVRLVIVDLNFQAKLFGLVWVKAGRWARLFSTEIRAHPIVDTQIDDNGMEQLLGIVNKELEDFTGCKIADMV